MLRYLQSETAALEHHIQAPNEQSEDKPSAKSPRRNQKQHVPFFPEEDTKLRATSLAIRRGGNCPNSLEVIQQFVSADELQLSLVTVLPSQDSAATRRVKSSFGEDTPVSFQHCIYRADHAEAASSYALRSAAKGSRTLVNYNDLPEMTIDEFEHVARSFDTSDETWWHFEGRIPKTTSKCVQLLRTVLPTAKVSVEIEKPGREGLPELAAEADVVFFSRTWAENRGHASAEACLRGEQLPTALLALCTWGSDGAAALSRRASECVRCQATKDVTVVDAVGAGDTFIAGMLYGLLCHDRDWDDHTKLTWAVQLASLKVQQEGFSGLGGGLGGKAFRR